MIGYIIHPNDVHITDEIKNDKELTQEDALKLLQATRLYCFDVLEGVCLIVNADKQDKHEDLNMFCSSVIHRFDAEHCLIYGDIIAIRYDFCSNDMKFEEFDAK